MAEEDQTDPFLWDEDRIVQELCTPNRTWKSPAAKRLPDPAALEAKLRDCGVDGESFLTYGDEFGFHNLWSHLGVRKLPHQLSLKDAITQLRKRSQGYSEWKARQLADSQPCAEENSGLAIKSELHQPASPEHVVPATSLPGSLVSNPDADPRAAPLGLPNSRQGVLSPALSSSADRDLPPPSGVSEVPGPDQEVVEEPPKKKRRVAPTNISVNPTGNSDLANIPTEGDLFLSTWNATLQADESSVDPTGNIAASNILTEDDIFSRSTTEAALQADNSFGFLGEGAWQVNQHFHHQIFDEPGVSKTKFGQVLNNYPPGRCIQVSEAMKRYLRAGRLDRSKPDLDHEEDVLLPCIGDPDDESVDSETFREYQEEEAERLAREEANRKRLLTKEQVTDAVRDAVQELESQWITDKKPRHDLRAWKIWQNARRNPDRLALIDSKKTQLGHLEARIKLYSQHIIAQPWSVNDAVHRKASDILEVSIFEKMHQAWSIDVLGSPRQPPKPSTLPRPTPKSAKLTVLDDDEEDLTSGSDDMDAFIEYDDNAVLFVNDPMELDLEPPTPAAALSVNDPMELDLEPPTPAAVPANLGRDDFAAPGPADEADFSLPPAEEASSGEQVNGDLSVHPTPKKIKSEQPEVPTTPRRPYSSAIEVIDVDALPTPSKPFDQVPSLDDLESLKKIGEFGLDYWEKVADAERLVVAVLCEWPRAKIVKLHAEIKNHDHSGLWARYIEPTTQNPSSATADSIAFLLCRLFDVFVSKTAKRAHAPSLRAITCRRIISLGPFFADFCAFLGRVLPLFCGIIPRTPTRIVLKTPQVHSLSIEENAGIRDPADGLRDSEEDSSDDAPPPSTKKRRQPKRHDKNAQKMRTDTLKVKEEQAQRARQLREQIAELGSVSSKQSRLIVNETKESQDESLIYINDHIGSKIKNHQIEGIRFMWNQLVVPSGVRQGCLLAHTMGLGKTMQVITLLVVIAESSASPDESVLCQIPENLRESKTLVLCPTSLVDNWHEEIQIWAPNGILGPVHKMHATLSTTDRVTTFQDWASHGGVLIIGYSLFSNLVRDDEEVAKLLQEQPNLVIADEAHKLKNPDSQRHQAAAKFKTTSRIAMTGSPLTNNVMDYYSMINWVAPGYLADIAEFRQKFANPIKEGLYADSDPYHKRKARKMLQVLKATVDPKVHRRDIQVLVGEVPNKKEFIITLPLTKLQDRLYRKYIELVMLPRRDSIVGQAKFWSLVGTLALVLAHPLIFKTVAEAKKAKRMADKAKSSFSTPGSTTNKGDVEELPQDVLHDLLAAVAVREIEDYALSNKIRILLRILDECKKVRDKVLVFSQSLATLDYIENICKRQKVVYQRLDGHTRPTTRQDLVHKFNTDPSSEVYLISTTAGGVGLNIHGANRVVIFDFKYTPADEQQAIGRAFRLGQTKPVYVYWLQNGGTFEDTIQNNTVFKTQLASRVVDKKNPDPWSKRFAEYFAMPRPVEQGPLNTAEDQVLDALLKNEDIKKLVRSITSTETFEKEETYELTPEDKKEVEDDVKLELLRSQNPEEFRRLERQRFEQSRSVLMGTSSLPFGFYQPQPANGESHAAPQCTSNQINRMIRIKVPEHLRENRKLGPSVPAVAPRPVSPQRTSGRLQSQISTTLSTQILTLNSDTAPVGPPAPFTLRPPLGNTGPALAPALAQPLPIQDNPVIEQARPPPNDGTLDKAVTQVPKTTPPPQPILGTGTHFKIPEAPLPSPLAPPSGTSISSSTGAPSLMATESMGPGYFPDLHAVHSRLCQEGRHVRQHPNDLISRVKEVLAQNKVETLPMMDKMQNINKISRNPRFAEAMLSGYLEPEQLASLTRLEMEGISDSLTHMGEGEFKQRVWTAKADLNVCTGTKSTDKFKDPAQRLT